MGKSSTVATLPPDILEQLQALLRDPRVTQLEATHQINAILAQKGEDLLSKSAVNRYAIKMDKVGQKLVQSREIAKMWVGKLGNEPQGEVGKLLNEVVRNLAFECSMQMAEAEGVIDPKMLQALAIAIEKLEKATSENEKREDQIKNRLRDELNNALDSAEGLDKRTLKQVRAEILEKVLGTAAP